MKTDKTEEKKTRKTATKKLETGPSKLKEAKYVLRLYVAGTTSNSVRAIENIKRICEEFLKGHYVLEVVDIYQQPVLAKGDQIIAVPTLIKKLPPPLRKFIGDMSSTERILVGLDLRPK
ncbi:MAG: circadian clock KaiB family protein [Ignavibacteria bacterium]|nr:circadian clock KaiB family protein [Ignavibacteria bacterium]